MTKTEANELYRFLIKLGLVPKSGFGKVTIAFNNDQLVHTKKHIEIEIEEDIKPV